jgi:hypothetical protein
MPFCVQIVLKPQIILYVVHLRRFSEISWFKSAVKNQHVMERRHWNGVLRCFKIVQIIELWKFLI